MNEQRRRGEQDQQRRRERAELELQPVQAVDQGTGPAVERERRQGGRARQGRAPKRGPRAPTCIG